MPTATVELDKAVKNLNEAILQPKDDFLRDAVIRRFTLSVELAWKTSKKIMGTATSAPKEVVREMAQNGYIPTVDLWLQAIDMRNISSHTYKEELAEKVYSFAVSFYPSLQNLTQILKTK
ncbi:MAG: nucleotidyltransferase substrate binding protein [Bdellovibrio sp.]|nr:nucleotidyltransferase substrate binding protein [Bdellovibrio sp.]